MLQLRERKNAVSEKNLHYKIPRVHERVVAFKALGVEMISVGSSGRRPPVMRGIGQLGNEAREGIVVPGWEGSRGHVVHYYHYNFTPDYLL